MSTLDKHWGGTPLTHSHHNSSVILKDPHRQGGLGTARRPLLDKSSIASHWRVRSHKRIL
jgi:hypothetical protein